MDTFSASCSGPGLLGNRPYLECSLSSKLWTLSRALSIALRCRTHYFMARNEQSRPSNTTTNTINKYTPTIDLPQSYRCSVCSTVTGNSLLGLRVHKKKKKRRRKKSHTSEGHNQGREMLCYVRQPRAGFCPTVILPSSRVRETCILLDR